MGSPCRAESAAEVRLPDGRTAHIAAEGKEAVPFRVRLGEGGKVEVAVLKGAARGQPARSARRGQDAVRVRRGRLST